MNEMRKDGRRGTERFIHLPKVTQIVSRTGTHSFNYCITFY